MTQTDPSPPKRHPRNVPGDFYIEDGCCTSCGVMHIEASDLLGWEENVRLPHCFVAKQPATAEELTCMLDAMFVSDLDCLNYGGTDPDIVDRIAIIGHSGLLDLPPRLHGGSSARSYATFTAEGLPFSIRASTLANRFIRQYTSDTSRWHKREAKIVISSHKQAVIRLTWFSAVHHTVTIMEISPRQ